MPATRFLTPRVRYTYVDGGSAANDLGINDFDHSDNRGQFEVVIERQLPTQPVRYEKLVEEAPALYLCRGYACQAPVTEAASVSALFEG